MALSPAADYLVQTGGCNDSHTEGDGARGSEIPEAEWLLGSSSGSLGPWGTRYATNLRLTAAKLHQTAWLSCTATLQARPLMPADMLRKMHEQDHLGHLSIPARARARGPTRTGGVATGSTPATAVSGTGPAAGNAHPALVAGMHRRGDMNANLSGFESPSAKAYNFGPISKFPTHHAARHQAHRLRHRAADRPGQPCQRSPQRH